MKTRSRSQNLQQDPDPESRPEHPHILTSRCAEVSRDEDELTGTSHAASQLLLLLLHRATAASSGHSLNCMKSEPDFS
ncbi:hypothetical protein INR49_010993, partial [Caranx melampygus]